MTKQRSRGINNTPTEVRATVEELFPLVYDQLRRLARNYLIRERPGHTLQPTALVHEAYLKLMSQHRAEWKTRTHFFAVGARIMRQLLIDHARRRGAVKRGGGWYRVTLAEEIELSSTFGPDRLLALDHALHRLAAKDERAAQVATLRLFSGLSPEEVAAAVGVSLRTASNDWRHALAWLRSELDSSAAQ